MKTINRIGETNTSNEGYEMEIIEYINAKNIFVEFQDEHKMKVHTTYGNFKNGNVKNSYHPNVCGVGYLGEGKYKAKENGKDTEVYKKWHDMLRRCYDPYYLDRHPTYRDCMVCEEWLNFQNFAKWYEENVYECDNEETHLDKDILIKGNKIYSTETCVLVPKRINSLFTKCNAIRGKYPIGVNWHKATNKFVAQCNVLDKENNRKVHLGLYDSIEEAFLAYKQFKEGYIKQIADEYKDLIPTKLYDALYRWEVEIDD